MIELQHSKFTPNPEQDSPLYHDGDFQLIAIPKTKQWFLMHTGQSALYRAMEKQGGAFLWPIPNVTSKRIADWYARHLAPTMERLMETITIANDGRPVRGNEAQVAFEHATRWIMSILSSDAAAHRYTKLGMPVMTPKNFLQHLDYSGLLGDFANEVCAQLAKSRPDSDMPPRVVAAIKAHQRAVEMHVGIVTFPGEDIMEDVIEEFLDLDACPHPIRSGFKP